jgi:hypothetical protein
MKAFAIFLLFIGILLIIQGYYSDRTICPKEKVLVKYVPRSFYEEQLSPSDNLKLFYRGMFEDVSLLSSSL